MGKKKIALVDLSQSETAQLKASGVRSQKLTKTKTKKTVEAPLPVAEIPLQEPIKKEKEIVKEIKKIKKRVKHHRSKRYLNSKKLVDKKKTYPIPEAVKLLREISQVKFDATVEFHANLTCEKLSGELSLPHGTGRKQKVVIASEELLAKLNDGVIDFDVLVSEPQFMPKLAKYAKILGPKGLMPNPKNGTISPQPEAVKKKLEAGAFRYKSEPKAPLLHLVIGKLSFKDEQLIANIATVIATLQPKNFSTVYLCSSMSPSIKLQLE
ncbi:MAG: hypothetical protein NTZ93_04445 [Candidatus Beckwithbacteria bacterium]|nr:hypothetical protein [Candidatus Beckwithbacteria bacterium]